MPDALTAEDSEEENFEASGSRDKATAGETSRAVAAGPAAHAVPSPRAPPQPVPAPLAQPAVPPETLASPPPPAPPRNAVARPVSPSSAPPPLPLKAREVKRPAVEPPEERKQPEEVAAGTAEPAAVAAGIEDTPGFASFAASAEWADSGGSAGGVAVGKSTPDMPRHAPPRVPSPPPFAFDEQRTDEPRVGSSGGGGGASNGSDDRTAGDDVGNAAVGTAAVDDPPVDNAAIDNAGPGGAEDDPEWSDDPFDDFQTAPPASPPPPPRSPPPLPPLPPRPSDPTAAQTVVGVKALPPIPKTETETPAWTLDFLMAAPAKAGGGEAGKGGALFPGLDSGGAGVSSEAGAKSAKPLDLVR